MRDVNQRGTAPLLVLQPFAYHRQLLKLNGLSLIPKVFQSCEIDVSGRIRHICRCIHEPHTESRKLSMKIHYNKYEIGQQKRHYVDSSASYARNPNFMIKLCLFEFFPSADELVRTTRNTGDDAGISVHVISAYEQRSMRSWEWAMQSDALSRSHF